MLNSFNNVEMLLVDDWLTLVLSGNNATGSAHCKRPFLLVSDTDIYFFSCTCKSVRMHVY